MTSRRRTTAAVLAGGVALASAGFAIGSQSGDGSAEAGSRAASGDRTIHFRGPGGPRLESLADRLGVSESALREALEDLRPTGDPGDELAAALASALGRDQADVEQALDGLRSQHERGHDEGHAEFAAELAGELGLDASDVRAALEEVKPEPPRGHMRRAPRPNVLLGRLAGELGVSRARLREALQDVRPGGPGPGGPRDHRSRGPAGFAEDIADALGVDADRVEQALEDFREAKHDEFVKQLAEKLGIDEDKVRDTLPSHP